MNCLYKEPLFALFIVQVHWNSLRFIALNLFEVLADCNLTFTRAVYKRIHSKFECIFCTQPNCNRNGCCSRVVVADGVFLLWPKEFTVFPWIWQKVLAQNYDDFTLNEWHSNSNWNNTNKQRNNVLWNADAFDSLPPIFTEFAEWWKENTIILCK